MLNKVAFIDAHTCIGCNKCVPVCPVDCIIGAPQYLHTVIANECIGCNKCIPVCPVDCIDIIEKNITINKNKTKARVNAKKHRLESAKQEEQKHKYNVIENIDNKLQEILNKKQ